MFIPVRQLLGQMWEEGVTKWYQSMVQPSDWMDGVYWSCMHVSCMCVSYTCISCACCICLMIDYGCSNVAMEKLDIYFEECICHEYMTGCMWLYVA